MQNRKNFVIDTSVMLYDKNSIHSFKNHDVIIPMVVLDELDRFKDKQGLLGENARYVNRYLDGLRELGKLHEGVTIENGQTIRVEKNHMGTVPSSLDLNSGDNQIIGTCLFLSESDKDKKTIVVTKDINFRVKCDSLNILSEDYYRDRIVNDSDEIYTGQTYIDIDHKESFDNFFDNSDPISLDDLGIDLFSNQYVVAKFNNQSLLGVVKNNHIHPLTKNLDSLIKVNARNKEQKFALDLLTREDISIVTLTGIAGSGKTFLTLMAALSGINSKKYDRVIFTRSIEPVGKEIGFLPGDIKDKMDPWIAPLVDNFRHAFKDTSYFEVMRDKGVIEVAPMAFIRGRTFSKSIIIVDEAQNASIHELKTIITRVGDDSKIILLGDVEQIDTPYLDTLSNGLTIVIEKFKKEGIAGHVTLMKGERSKLATLASKII
jgi:PhoH-like ATPase